MDRTPDICRWFGDHGFQQHWLSPHTDAHYAFGVHRFIGDPMPMEPGVRMFTVVGSGGRPPTDPPDPADAADAAGSAGLGG